MVDPKKREDEDEEVEETDGDGAGGGDAKKKDKKKKDKKQKKLKKSGGGDDDDEGKTLTKRKSRSSSSKKKIKVDGDGEDNDGVTQPSAEQNSKKKRSSSSKKKKKKTLKEDDAAAAAAIVDPSDSEAQDVDDGDDEKITKVKRSSSKKIKKKKKSKKTSVESKTGDDIQDDDDDVGAGKFTTDPPGGDLDGDRYVSDAGESKQGADGAEAAADGAETATKQSFMQAAGSKALRPFVIISSSYLLFTITDGAIRMIVLLHAYNKSFSALEVAVMFTLYELAGVFTNLAAGIMGARWGIKFTLICGLSLQLVSYALLFGWQDDWSKTEAIIYVTFAQMFAGVAKDLTKLGGKTVTKLVTPDEQDTKLFKLVSFITGWKNSLKGVGYFLGSALLEVSYEAALLVMMALVVIAMPWAILGLDRNLGTAKKKNAAWHEVFDFSNHNLTWLSLARLFLFASRDFWFEVPLPFFLRSPSCEGLGEELCMIDDDCSQAAICGTSGFCENINPGGGCGGPGVERFVVGAFLGGYIILYGQFQSWTPQLVTGPLSQTPPNKLTEILWGYINCLPTLVGWIVLAFAPSFQNYELTPMTIWIVVIVVTFAVIFAINSSIHSYLVVAYAAKDKVAVSVGFYYMSNAVGRLFGTLGSGILYTYVGEDFGDLAGSDAVAGLAACFLAGTVCSFLAATITFRIDDHSGGLKCGPCWTVVPPTIVEEKETDGGEKVDGKSDFAAVEDKV